MVVTNLTRINAEHFATIRRTNLPMELIGGKIITTPASKGLHQAVSVRILQVMQGLNAGGELGYDLAEIYLDEFNVLQPDIFWVSGQGSSCKKRDDGHWHGAPELVVEVIADGSGLRDRREKFQLYEKHGVREYWLVDPRDRYIEIWQAARKHFKRMGLFTSGETFESAALGGKSIEMKGLFAPAAA